MSRKRVRYFVLVVGMKMDDKSNVKLQGTSLARHIHETYNDDDSISSIRVYDPTKVRQARALDQRCWWIDRVEALRRIK